MNDDDVHKLEYADPQVGREPLPQTDGLVYFIHLVTIGTIIAIGIYVIAKLWQLS
jgi:hypothetical protein